MKRLIALSFGALPLLIGGAASAQSGPMMYGGMGDAGWMGGFGGHGSHERHSGHGFKWPQE